MTEDLNSILTSLEELLHKLSVEAQKNIDVVILDVNSPEERVHRRIEENEQFDNSTIEIRVKRRHESRPTRFSLQALTNDLSPDSGFNGFMSSGRLSESGDVELFGRANRYNMPNWDSGFRSTTAKS